MATLTCRLSLGGHVRAVLTSFATSMKERRRYADIRIGYLVDDCAAERKSDLRVPVEVRIKRTTSAFSRTFDSCRTPSTVGRARDLLPCATLSSACRLATAHSARALGREGSPSDAKEI